MTGTIRPGLDRPHGRELVDAFVATLQDGIDRADADRFNERFAADVLWGSPFGAVVEGYDDIHAIHTSMFAAAADAARAAAAPADPADPASGGGSTYTVEHVRFPTDDVAIAYVRRTRAAPSGELGAGRAESFDELALLVLARRDDGWWLAAGQHVPDRRREIYG